MTTEQLIAEGRHLQRSCSLLRPQQNGPVVAMWYDWFERDETLPLPERHRLLTLDARRVPGLMPPLDGFINIFCEPQKWGDGHVEITPSWPARKGLALYAYPVAVLPPIDAVFARGSDRVGEWIQSHGWERTERYNDNFEEKDVVAGYERIWMQEYPLYSPSEAYAVLGGWHWPCADDDWHDLIDEQLVALTIRNAEPWIEAWRMRSGEFRVIHRIT